MVTSNPNKMRRMNNEGRWIYKKEKKEPPNPSHHPKDTFFLTPWSSREYW